MGHVTYGNMLVDYFESSTDFDMVRVWLDANRELHTRILIRLLCHYSVSIPRIKNGNLDLRRYRAELGSGYMGRRQAQRNVRAHNPDILHFLTQSPAVLSIDIMKRIPTAVSIDMTARQMALEQASKCPQWTFQPNINLDQRVFDAARWIFTYSEWAARSVVNDFKIDTRKVSVVYPGMDLTRFKLAGKERSKKTGKVQLLFVGNDFVRKGGVEVLEVFSNSFSHTCELNIVTNSALEPNHPNIRVYRNVKAHSEDWHRLYERADIFVLPTRFDAFGLVFVEAIASGLPVIATNINAIPEIITHHESGLLVEPGDTHCLAEAIRALVDDPDKRRSMGLAARRQAEVKFDSARTVKVMESALSELAPISAK
jgi:glycosyltransferase involved in cell wall biosynthesis